MSGHTPVFPLNTVLFPGGTLPLRIFETRYIDMLRECLRTENHFLVCLIILGSESGEASFHDIGTTAEVMDWGSGEDGLLNVVCVGRRRGRVRSSSVMPDGLNVAEVELLPVPEAGVLQARHVHLAELLQRVIAVVSLPVLETHRYEDPTWVADRLSEVLPFSLSQRQRFLEMDDADERLDLVDELLPSMKS